MRKVAIGLLTLAVVAAGGLVAWSSSKQTATGGHLTSKTLAAPAAPASPSATPMAAPAKATAKKAAASPTAVPTLNPKHKTAGASPGCGETVKSSIHLTTNIINCPGDGLIVGAKDVTIDLNDYTIGGVKADHSAGIRNPKAYTGLTVRGGVIQSFDDGVVVTGKGTTKNAIVGIEFSNLHRGIVLDTAKSNEIRSNTIESTDGAGIEADSDSNTIRDNEITAARPAIKVSGSGNEISENTIKEGGDGIAGAGQHNQIFENDMQDGAGSGVVLLGSSNMIRDNTVKRFGGAGIWLQQTQEAPSGGDGGGGSTSTAVQKAPTVKKAKDNVVLDNDVSRGGHDGILVDSDSSTIDSNGSSRNAGDGIATRGANPLIQDNDARNNGGKGINASGGARGSGNSAGSNTGGDCSPQELCD